MSKMSEEDFIFYFIPSRQSAVRVLYLVRVLYPSPYFIPSPQSVVRSPQSAVRSPYFILTNFVTFTVAEYGAVVLKVIDQKTLAN